jgi:DNA-directed RNA polymerase alpha subunit
LIVPKGTLCTCKKGHQYQKSSDCPTCPICEKERAPKKGFMSELSAPARRALENVGIKTVTQLAKKTEQEILNLHGMGQRSIPKLRKALQNKGLSFRKN